MEMNTSSIHLIATGKDGGKDVLIIGLKEAFRSKPNYQRYMRQEYNRGKDLDSNDIFKYIALKEDSDIGLAVETEWEDCRTLTEWLQEGHTDDEKRRVFRQVANAISYMHSRGMVHGNLNAGNVFITRKSDDVKLLTFRLRYTDILKQPQDLLKYVAPEAKDGTVGLDDRADIYSLGVLLKDMGFSTEYHNVIEKCCRFGRNERFESVAQLMDAVDRRRFNRPSDELTDAQPSMSSNKKMAVIIAAIAVLACVAVALLVVQRGGGQNQTEPSQTEQVDSSAQGNADMYSTNSQQPQASQSADTTQNQPADTDQVQGDNAFLNDLVPQMHADLDKIYNSEEDPAVIHAKVGAYYKGLRRALKKQHKSAGQLDAFDKAFAEYIQQKNQ
ncbi:protein kinase [Hallella multisaccharivorax]|uniref:protein kinase domain-containing protein n=1 Tax=Hallella multisaccharivorax TaxID=310514 RepID=UPI00362146E4